MIHIRIIYSLSYNSDIMHYLCNYHYMILMWYLWYDSDIMLFLSSHITAIILESYTLDTVWELCVSKSPVIIWSIKIYHNDIPYSQSRGLVSNMFTKNLPLILNWTWKRCANISTRFQIILWTFLEIIY